MYQLLPLVVAAVSGVSASANVEKKVVKAMEGCQIVWEEKENCVTESNVEICRMKDTQQCEEVPKKTNSWSFIGFGRFSRFIQQRLTLNILGVKNGLPTNYSTGALQVYFGAEVAHQGTVSILQHIYLLILTRRKREALVEKHKGTGKLLLPGDLRSV